MPLAINMRRDLTLLVLLIASGLLTACTEHIHDPWAAEGEMSDERNVGPQQEEELETRLLLGQSDR